MCELHGQRGITVLSKLRRLSGRRPGPSGDRGVPGAVDLEFHLALVTIWVTTNQGENVGVLRGTPIGRLACAEENIFSITSCLVAFECGKLDSPISFFFAADFVISPDLLLLFKGNNK